MYTDILIASMSSFLHADQIKVLLHVTHRHHIAQSAMVYCDDPLCPRSLALDPIVPDAIGCAVTNLLNPGVSGTAAAPDGASTGSGSNFSRYLQSPIR